MTEPSRCTDDETCWCHVDREGALDRAYPDRCQIPFDDSTPSAGDRHCTRPAGHTEPCQGMLNRAGSPCHYCGGPTGDAATCSDCWQPFTVADFRWLCAEAGVDSVQSERGWETAERP